MQMKRKMLRHSAYRKLFLSFLLLTSITISVVCMTLYTFFSVNSVKEVGNISKSMLRQTSYIANIVNQQVYEIGNHLINNTDIVSAMFNPDLDRIKEYRVVMALSDIQSGYPFLNFIGIYNGYTDRYMNNKGISRQDENELLQNINHEREKKYSSLYPRIIKDPVNGRDVNVLTFVLQPGYNSYLPKKGAIVINIEEKYIQRLIQGMKNNSSNFIIVTDDKGTIFSHSDGAHFLENNVSDKYIRDTINSKESSGNFTTEINGETHLVSFVKSNELNWYFISVNRYKDLLSNLNHLRGVVLSIALAMLVLCIVVSLWLTNQMYNPMEKLLRKMMSVYKKNDLDTTKKINEYLLLGEAFQNIADKVAFMGPALNIAKKSYLLNYFKGSQEDLSNRYHEPLRGPYFLVILLKIDGFAEFSNKHSEKSQSLIRFAVCNIAQELTGMETVVVDADEIGVLGQLDTAITPVELPRLVGEIQENVIKFFKISVSASIGSIVQTDADIRNSYAHAKEALQGRFFAGKGHMFTYAEECHDSKEEFRYPSNLEKKLIEAIQISHHETVHCEMEELIHFASRLPYDQALLCLNQLIISMYIHFDLSAIGKREAKNFIEIATSLINYETIHEAADDLKQVCYKICDNIKAKTKGRQNDIVEVIKEFIDHNYAKPDLSLEVLADQVQLTPGYLGKIFKAYSKMSFNDYLKHVRLEKAKELLLATNESANIISEKIGIYNTTYFYTLFKKKYGVSPAQFRSEALGEKLG